MMAQGENDFFRLLGMPRTFGIDRKKLEDAYFDACKKAHPDRAPEGERVRAAQQTADLNDAYKALRDEAKRAEHLLALHGVLLSDKDAVSPALLVEMMEAREELAHAQASGDEDAIASLEEQMIAKRKSYMASIAESFRSYDQSGERSHLEAVKQALVILRYVDRYLEACEE